MLEHRDDIHPTQDDHASAGDRISRRGLVRGLWAAAAVAVLAALFGVALRGGGNSSNVRTASRAATTTTAAAVPAVSAGAPPVVVPVTETTAPTGTGAPAKVTTTRPAATGLPVTCRNSTDPRCGAFSWNPSPGPNSPIKVQVTGSEVAGDIKFHVVVDDPDARILRDCNWSWTYGSEKHAGAPCEPRTCAAAYGPWTPPARTADHYEIDFIAKPQPGEHQATFNYSSGGGCPPNPYGGTAAGSVIVSVSPPTTAH